MADHVDLRGLLIRGVRNVQIRAKGAQKFLAADHAERKYIKAAAPTLPIGYGADVHELSDTGYAAAPDIYYLSEHHGRWLISNLD